MQWSLRLFAPSIAILNGSGALLLRLFGVASTGHRHVHSPEEIELLIAESRDGGLLEPLEQVRLHRALRLGLRTAKQLMVPRERLAALDASTPFAEVLRLVATSPYSRLPVYRGTLDHVDRHAAHADVVLDYISDRPRGSVAALLRPILRVRETMPADRLLAFLRERRSHHGARRGRQRAHLRADHARGRRRRAARRRVGRVQGRGAARDSPAGRPGAAAGRDAPRSGGPGRRRVARRQRDRRVAHRRRARARSRTG